MEKLVALLRERCTPAAPSIERPEFGFVVAVTSLVLMQVAKTRYEVFDKAFVSKHLAEDDKRIRALNGKGIGKGCHPDAGMGRWADKLPIDQWWRFNKAQRAAGNYLEAICPLTAFLLIVGAYHPLTATAQGVAYLAGRWMYTSGFKADTGSRVNGFVLCTLTQLSLFGLCVFCGLRQSGSLAQAVEMLA